MPTLPPKKKSARARRARQLESSQERQELEQLRRAEEELGAIFAAMEPLWKALPRVRLRYEWLRWLQDHAGPVPGGAPMEMGFPPAAAEYRIPGHAVREGLERPEVLFRAINPAQPPEPDTLSSQIDAFYCAFNELFRAARDVEVPSEIRERHVDEEPARECDGTPVEVQALTELKRALERNSIQERYRRVAALLRAVIERRRLLECWHTPEGRKQELETYCRRHGLTIERFVKELGCDRSSVYNWSNCKGLGTGWCAKLIEQVLRQNIPPDEIAVLKAKLKPESF